MEKDKKTLKVFKNELKMLVATEKEMYHNIKPNGSNFIVIDVLPDNRPIYAILDVGPNKAACIFEFLLGETPDLVCLISSSHKFPSKKT